jgi:hypothetical protein
MDRCPRLPQLSPGRLVVAPAPQLANLFDRLGHSQDLVERLVSVYEVLSPQLVDSYSLHLEHTSRVSEGPVARALELVLADERRDGAEGRALLRSIAGADRDSARTYEVRADLVGWLSGRALGLAWGSWDAGSPSGVRGGQGRNP